MSIADLNTAKLDLDVKSLTLDNLNSNMTFSRYFSESLTLSASGPYSSPQSVSGSYVRLDDIVTLTVSGLAIPTTSTTSTITLAVTAGLIPAPAEDAYFPVVLFSTNSSANVEVIGYGKLSSVTGFTIHSLAPSSFFNVSGFRSFTISYLAA